MDNQQRILNGEEEYMPSNQDESQQMPKLNYQYSNQVSMKKEISSPSDINFYGGPAEYGQNDDEYMNNSYQNLNININNGEM